MKSRYPVETLLEDCLQQLQHGVGLDEVLAQHPKQAQELRPMLVAALASRSLGEGIHTPAAAQARSLSKVLAKTQAMGQPQRSPAVHHSFRFAFALLALVAVLVLGGLSAVAVSAQALPGDKLYDLKLATENTRLFFTRDSVRRMELEQTYDQKRADEVEELIQHSRSSEVTFTGSLTQTSPTEWQVANVRVFVTPQTQITAQDQPGILVEVHGFLQADGAIVADRIRPLVYSFSGNLQLKTGDQWVISGIKVMLAPRTVIKGSPTIGSLVTVQGVRLADGSLQAILVDVIKGESNEPAKTEDVIGTQSPESPEHELTPAPGLPSPTLEPDDKPEPIEASQPGEALKPRETSEPVEEIQPDIKIYAGDTPEPVEIGESGDTPEAGEIGEPTGVSIDTESLQVTPTLGPHESPLPNYQPSHTPEPTNSPDHTYTPEPTNHPDRTNTPKPTHD